MPNRYHLNTLAIVIRFIALTESKFCGLYQPVYYKAHPSLQWSNEDLHRNLIMLKNYCPPPTSGANNTWRSYIPNFIPVKLIDNSKSKPAKKEQVLGETTAQPKVSRRIEYPELYKDVSMTKAPCVNPTETYQTEALSSLYLPEDAMRFPLTELDMTKLETWLAERSIVLRRGSSLTMDGPTAKLCKKYAGDFDSLISKIANQEEAKVAASKESGPDDNEMDWLADEEDLENDLE